MQRLIRNESALLILALAVVSLLTWHPAQAAVVFSENFDGVAAPTLPAGWTVSATGSLADTPWATSTTDPFSAPNAAFTPDPSTVGTNKLDSPVISLPLGTAQLSFQNSTDLEDMTGTIGFDGGVLEISIDGDAFQDIIAAGGSFVTGGYNRTISSAFSSPIAGRQAWSGDSDGYFTTTVNLPAAAAGENIQLRWFLGTDNSVADQFWRIDSVVVDVAGTVPEPSTLFLLGLGLPAVVAASRRALRTKR